MDPDRYQRVKQYFQRACDMPPAEQQELLATLAEDVAGEVGTMLAAFKCSRQDAFFAVLDPSDEKEQAARAPLCPPDHDHPAQLETGSRLGAYQLESVLGEGGMGVVYRASRVDAAFESQVALKILKRGMDTNQIVARFKNERQILADLHHANIATIHDGGSTPDGRPYLVMEWVKGQTLHQYCDTGRLTIEQRLRLFLDICRAVAFAHRHLVVHRDLKPGNILVTAAGVPKLLDFGIAKILNPDREQRQTITEFGSLPMTPAYAGPEQIRGGTITTACDIYALGVLLYELLSGHSPYQLDQLTPHNLVQTICESSVVKPSEQFARNAATTRISGSDNPAAERRLSGKVLHRRLQGDLDNIVLKAIAKQPELRYQSVNHLADDLERFLDARPVLARAPSLPYRIRKFSVRYRRPLAVFAAFLALTFGFTIALFFQQQRTAVERDLARRERDNAKQVTDLLVSVFESSDPAQARGQAPSAVDLLNAGRGRVAAELTDQPYLRAQLQFTLAKVYRSLGHFDTARPLLAEVIQTLRQSNGEREFLAQVLLVQAEVLWRKGAYDQAESHAREAAQLCAAQGGQTTATAAECDSILAEIHHAQGRDQAAEPLFQRALARRRALFPANHALVLTSTNNLAAFLFARGDYARAEELMRQVRRTRLAVLGHDHPLVAADAYNLAAMRRRQGDDSEAEQLFTEALLVRQKLFDAQHPAIADCLNSLGVLHYSQRRYPQAETFLRQALQMRTAFFGTDHPATAQSQNDLANLFVAQKKFAEAQTLYNQALTIREQLFGANHPSVAASLNNLAGLQQTRGNLAEAESLFGRALAMRIEHLGPLHPDVAVSLHGLALLKIKANQRKAAEPLLRRALVIRKKTLGTDHPHYATVLNDLGACLYTNGKYAEAEPIYRQSLARIIKSYGPTSAQAATVHNNLAGLQQSLGLLPEAEASYRQALHVRRQVYGDAHAKVATSRHNLAVLLHESGLWSEAEQQFQAALDQRRRLLGPAHPRVTDTLGDMADLYNSQQRFSAAEVLLLEAFAGTAGPRRQAVNQSIYGATLAGLDRPNQAEPLLSAACRQISKQRGANHRRTLRAAARLEAFYSAFPDHRPNPSAANTPFARTH